MRNHNANRVLLVISIVLALSLAACDGLAGEPEIVGVVPQQAAPQTGMSTDPPTVGESSGSAQTAAVTERSLDEVDLALGAEIYAARCTDCHGDTGAGDGALVESGQIASIMDFTDPATIADKTPADYFTAITDGNMQALMPPWRDALTEEERWAVTWYVYTLSADGAMPPQVVEADDTAAGESEASADSEPESTMPEASSVEGVIVGQVTSDSSDLTVPEDLVVTLRVLDSAFNEQTFDTTVDADGRFRFDEVTFRQDRGYIVTAEYEGGIYMSDMILGDVSLTEQTLDIVIQGTTDDPAALTLRSVLVQADPVPGGLRIVQLMEFINTTDRQYVREDAQGRTISASINLPEGAELSSSAAAHSLIPSEDGRTVYSTGPIPPGTQAFHVIYTLPHEDVTEVVQTLDYALEGNLDVFILGDQITVEGYGLTDRGTETVGDRIYRGYSANLVIPAGDNLSFTISGEPGITSTAAANGGEAPAQTVNPLAYVVMAAGVGSLMLAGALYFRSVSNGKSTPTQPTVPMPGGAPTDEVIVEPELDVEARIQVLMKQIADLDNRRDRQEISNEAYEERRAELKAELTDLIQQRADDA